MCKDTNDFFISKQFIRFSQWSAVFVSANGWFESVDSSPQLQQLNSSLLRYSFSGIDNPRNDKGNNSFAISVILPPLSIPYLYSRITAGVESDNMLRVSLIPNNDSSEVLSFFTLEQLPYNDYLGGWVKGKIVFHKDNGASRSQLVMAYTHFTHQDNGIVTWGIQNTLYSSSTNIINESNRYEKNLTVVKYLSEVLNSYTAPDVVYIGSHTGGQYEGFIYGRYAGTITVVWAGIGTDRFIGNDIGLSVQSWIAFQIKHLYMSIEDEMAGYHLLVILYAHNASSDFEIHAYLCKPVDFSLSVMLSYEFNRAALFALGANMWFTSDRKWLFSVPFITRNYGGKGLNIYGDGTTKILTTTDGFINNSTLVNHQKAKVIREAVANLYVQEIVFNHDETKLIFLCSTIAGGGMTDKDTHNPNTFLFFQRLSTGEWIQLPNSTVDRNGVLNVYNQSAELGEVYRASLSVNINHLGKNYLSWGYPAAQNNLNLYYSTITWGD